MLVDTQLSTPQNSIGVILGVIAGGRTGVSRIDRGMYLVHHWGFDHLLGSACVSEYGCEAFGAVKLPKGTPFETQMAAWREWEAEHPGLPGSYGVCDHPHQLVEKSPALNTDPRPLVVAFAPIRKADQDPEGSWRWHKWGDYIGDQTPTREYLYDEPDIDEVYTYHVYEIAPWAVIEGVDQ